MCNKSIKPTTKSEKIFKTIIELYKTQTNHLEAKTALTFVKHEVNGPNPI